jgi:hypothetical protein
MNVNSKQTQTDGSMRSSMENPDGLMDNPDGLIDKWSLDGKMVSPEILDELMVLLMDNDHLMNNGLNPLTWWTTFDRMVNWWANGYLMDKWLVTLEKSDRWMVFRCRWKSDGLKVSKKKHICTIFLKIKDIFYAFYPNHHYTPLSNQIFRSHLLPIFFSIFTNF